MNSYRQHAVKRGISLVLALLLLAAAPAALGAEAGSAAPAAGQEEQTSSPAPLPQDGEGQEGESAPEGQPEASPSPSPEASSGTEATPAPEATLAPEEGENLEPSLEETYDAGSLLVTGGHATYMSGYENGTFQPDRQLTRAEAAKVLHQLLAAKPAVSGSQFDDVAESQWYYEAVNALAQLEVIGGYGDGTFRPNNPITRAEFVKVLGMCFDLSTSGEVSFSDVSGHWAYPYIVSAVAKGWIDGYEDGTFRPDRPITRAEAVKIVNIALGRRGDGFAAERNEMKFIDVPSSHWAFLDVAEAARPGSDVTITVWVTATPSLNLRSQPSTTSSVLASLPTNTRLTVLSMGLDGWFQVRTSGGTTGYVSSEYVALQGASTPDPEPEEPQEPQGPSEDPNGTLEAGDTARVIATDGLRLRQSPVSGETITVMPYGTVVTVVSTSQDPWLQVRTSGGTTGYAHSDYLAPYTPGQAAGARLSADKLTLHQYQTARLDASVSSGMESMEWTSSNPDVAYVGYTVPYGDTSGGAMVYGNSPGTATLTFRDSAGNTSASCTVTVTAAEAVRFAYGEENSPRAQVAFDLVAVTDSSRSAVRFDVVNGSSYTVEDYATQSRNSSYGLPANTVRVFSQSVSFAAAGTYTVRAYSRSGSGWSSDYYQFQVVVSDAPTSTTTATTHSRRVSTAGLNIIANFEGSVPEVSADPIVSGYPTVGHGYVVPVNSAFYNNLTQAELFAQLVQVANESFSPAVESFRARYNMKMSQAQFDALTSFVFNLGVGTLNESSNWTSAVLVNAVDPTGISSGNPATGTLNAGDATIFTDTSLDSTAVATVPNGATVRVTDYKALRSSRQQEVWYYVTYGSSSGWMPAGNVRLSGNWAHDLGYADSTVLANNFLQWNRAGGRVWEGLVIRRLAECKIFFFGNYAEATPGNAEYRYNTYGFDFPQGAEEYDFRH